jgi:hypothetical protein
MDNNKITTYVLISLIISLTFGCLILGYRLNVAKEQNATILERQVAVNDSLIAEYTSRDAKADKTKDSLYLLLSAKKQTIINNTFTYEISKKGVATLNSSATDSLYSKSLQSAYKEYGYLLSNNK